MSLVFEMRRVYNHPFLAGCSEALCVKSDWATSFREASGKVGMMEYVMQAIKQVCENRGDYWKDKKARVLGVYSKSIRICQYLTKYFKLQGYPVCWLGWRESWT